MHRVLHIAQLFFRRALNFAVGPRIALEGHLEKCGSNESYPTSVFTIYRSASETLAYRSAFLPGKRARPFYQDETAPSLRFKTNHVHIVKRCGISDHSNRHSSDASAPSLSLQANSVLS